MTPTDPIPFDPELLEVYGIIRSTPAWKDVKDSMARLAPLRQPAAKPYDQMDLDRDNVLRYAGILRNSSDSIAYAICLAAHLARFSKTQVFEQRLNEGFQALSTGLDLPALAEADTRTELDRCLRGVFPNQKIELPSLRAPAPAPAPDAPQQPRPTSETPDVESAAAPSGDPAADAWRNALERVLTQIRDMDPLNIDSVIQKAYDVWQARLMAFLSTQPEVPPDIDYLRCRALNLPPGMILRGRLKNVSLREWNEAFVAGMSETGVTFPVPLWFSLAALGALGFDVPRDLSSVKSAEENKAASEFISKIPQTSPPKGLLILRVTAESQTAGWNISTSMPTLIITPTDFLREGKANLQSYFQPRLHGVLIEVGRDEQPAAALARANGAAIKEKLPSVRLGFLMAAQPQNAVLPSGYNSFAIMPTDAMDAYTKAFMSTS
ncbi:hypothetical protein EDE15_3557 [Edaphobacter aggregans]|uniref:Uncharacterized protein n=1 Tax=Edaphobacter aggregans TaxID=570835 RepID=A0A428MMN0_9BACT|nr:hypothetical protein [Edaphobacter aggregans]RSL18003.1 hypothetical protein EDE15_3557 [Edaphobacter aggregans]